MSTSKASYEDNKLRMIDLPLVEDATR
jgi:hypothetical protein